MKNRKLTKDRTRIGPPLGGVICFTVQATGLVYDPSGAAGLASLFAALVIGTTAGWLMEEEATRAIARRRKRCTTTDQAHTNNSLGAEVPYTDRRNQTGRT